MKRCKHCDSYGNHYCKPISKHIREDEDNGDFLTSAVIAAATDSAILGAVFGGDIAGAIIGSAFGD